MFTFIKEALITRFSTTNMHNLAVKRHKIVKILSCAKLSPREILRFREDLKAQNRENIVMREIKSSRNLKISRIS